jgi:hypothetical protein
MTTTAPRGPIHEAFLKEMGDFAQKMKTEGISDPTTLTRHVTGALWRATSTAIGELESELVSLRKYALRLQSVSG